MFPENPTPGQVWTGFGRTWTYNGDGWVASATRQATFPLISLADLMAMSPALYTGQSFDVTGVAGSTTATPVRSQGGQWISLVDNSPVVY